MEFFKSVLLYSRFYLFYLLFSKVVVDLPHDYAVHRYVVCSCLRQVNNCVALKWKHYNKLMLCSQETLVVTFGL